MSQFKRQEPINQALRPAEEPNDDAPVGRVISRREALGLFGSAGMALFIGGNVLQRANAATPTPTGLAGATPTATALPACIVRPELTEGPYFVDEMLKRIDIRTDPSTNKVSAGIPLHLKFRVSEITASACKPLEGAQVDIWHCDASGKYSDEQANNTVGMKFLRGYQVTDADGIAEFLTIYPGWYQGRTVHIHFKIRLPSSATAKTYDFTSQLFFDENLTDEIYAQAPYNTRGKRNQTNATDNIYQQSGGQLLLTITKDDPALTQLTATPDSAEAINSYSAVFDIGLALS